MQADTQVQVSFFLTGKRPSAELDAVDGLNLRPALFAGYRDLTQLRYDFPILLVEGRGDTQFAQSLSGLIDGALVSVAKGSDADRIRMHALRVEQAIRTLVTQGARAKFSVLWEQALAQLGEGTDGSFGDSVRRIRSAIKVDGPLVDCDAEFPPAFIQHAWASTQRGKATSLRKDIDRLVLKLSDILKADYERSAAGRSAKNLHAAVGSGFGNAFDFDAMSRMLSKALPKEDFPERRRKRIEGLLTTLKTQQFVASVDGNKPFSFLFNRCAKALITLRERGPKLMALAKAISIAELEISGQYSESRHDELFSQFGGNGLDPLDLARFPDYLVCLNATQMDAAEQAQLLEILSSDLPIKVLLQIDDILEESPDGEGGLSTGMRSRQIANMAMGLNQVYVMQSSSSALPGLRERVLRGMTFRGPALFSVYSGANAKASGLPPYLMAAAAMESRAFPAFSYDPSAGSNWASRFCLDANSQLELDWPIQNFAYEDEQHQRVSEDLAFTLVDFVASDHRYAKHLARVPKAKWNGSLIPIAESLTRDQRGLPDKVPSLLMVDTNNVLQKVIVDQRLMHEARRCLEMWHSLQELGGIHNSHAEKLLARERQAWEERMQQAAEAQVAGVPVATPAATTATSTDAIANAATEQEPERSRDDAYIETTRCSTCNECTTLNPKMFSYDGNKQAYIADINAGTYAQLVEAAESCQVSVIHPGKPRNPNEAGLEELLKRAEPFR